MELDQLICDAPELAQIITSLRAGTGVTPDAGGRHLGNGTHNALIGWGPARYLELLALDPEQRGGPFAAGIAHLQAPTLHTWCARAGSAASIAERIAAAGLRVRRLPLSRLRPDGVQLSWELLFPEGHAYGALLPFFIDWGEAPHPAGALRSQVRVAPLQLRHPDAAGLRTLLHALGGVPPEIEVVAGEQPEIAAAVHGPAGVWSRGVSA